MTTPTLVDKIKVAETTLVATKDALQAVTNKITALAEGENPDDADLAQIDELTLTLETQTKNLAALKKAEGALASTARPAGGGAPAVATGGHIQRKPDVKLFVRSAIAAFESHETHHSIEEIIARRWPNQSDLMEVSRLVTRAAQNPAMTTVPDWAGALVRETFGAFMDLLQVESVIPKMDMQRLEFNGFNAIRIPSRKPFAPGDQSLTGAFRKEGDPIRVGATQLTSKVLHAYTMGVIGTFTMEMLDRSPINFEDAVQRWMVEDTAVTLDTAFLDATAEVADTRPAGLRDALAAGDTAVSTGNTAANIQADLRGRLTAMSAAGLGRRPVWLMNPQRAWGVAMALTATDQRAFPEMANNTLVGVPVITSTTIPADVVFLVDQAECAFAGGTPRFSYSDQASLVEQNGLPLTNGVTGAVGTLDAGTPARSLWQTYSGGIRALWEVSWARLRDHSVQTITGVAW